MSFRERIFIRDSIKDIVLLLQANLCFEINLILQTFFFGRHDIMFQHKDIYAKEFS